LLKKKKLKKIDINIDDKVFNIEENQAKSVKGYHLVTSE